MAENSSNVGSHRGYLMFLKALTPIHVGSSETGIVDRPIQRDHLGLPIIFASSIKGALRHQIDWDKEEKIIFGQDPDESREVKQPGSIIFLDARPLFVPVRSLVGTYAYVTSPFLLKKLVDYAKISGLYSILGDTKSIKVEKGKAILVNGTLTDIAIKNEVYLNEIRFEVEDYTNDNNYDWIRDILNTVGLQEEPVLIVPDEKVVDLIKGSLIRYWRNKLQKGIKVVESGGLWCEEYIPDGTIFVSGFLKVLYKRRNKSNNSLLNIVKNKLEGYKIVTIGGLETIGKGLVELIVYPNKSTQ